MILSPAYRLCPDSKGLCRHNPALHEPPDPCQTCIACKLFLVQTTRPTSQQCGAAQVDVKVDFSGGAVRNQSHEAVTLQIGDSALYFPPSDLPSPPSNLLRPVAIMSLQVPYRGKASQEGATKAVILV